MKNIRRGILAFMFYVLCFVYVTEMRITKDMFHIFNCLFTVFIIISAFFAILSSIGQLTDVLINGKISHLLNQMDFYIFLNENCVKLHIKEQNRKQYSQVYESPLGGFPSHGLKLDLRIKIGFVALKVPLGILCKVKILPIDIVKTT